MSTGGENDLAGGRPAPSRPHFTWMGLAILGTVFSTAVAYQVGKFDELEAAARQFQAKASASRLSSDVVIVTITDEDFQAIFGGKRPLSPDGVWGLLTAIAAGRPDAIGVDLDTSDSAYRKFGIPEDWPPVVWGREAMCPDSEPCRVGDTRPGGVLGRSNPAVPSGLTAFEPDHHSTIRHYRRVFGTKAGPTPSLAWVLSRHRAGKAAGAGDSSRLGSPELLIDYRPSSAWKPDARKILSTPKGVLHGKTVLLGATFSDAKDRYETPLGRMSGVELHAQVLETELHGGGRRQPPWIVLAALQLAAAVFLLVVFLHLPARRAFPYTIVAAMAAAVVCSLAATASPIAGLPYFAPLLILIVVHQLYEKVSHYGEELVEDWYRRARGLPPREESLGPAVDRFDAGVRGLVGGIGRLGGRLARQRRHAGEKPPPATAPEPAGVPETAVAESGAGPPEPSGSNSGDRPQTIANPGGGD
ncbi:MAG: CHASE2 domain-containing protein [Gemmatimonadales bacterium]